MGDYGRQIYQELQKLNSNFSSFVSFFEGWADGISHFWDSLLDFLPYALWFLVLLVGVRLVIQVFFPKWGAS